MEALREKNRTALSFMCTPWMTGRTVHLPVGWTAEVRQVPVSPAICEAHPFRSESAPTL